MKQIKGLKIFSIKEATEIILDDLKVNEVCMLVFNIIMSCCVVASNMDHYFYHEKHDQKKMISYSEGMQEGISHTR